MRLQIDIDMSGPAFSEDPNWVEGYRPAYQLTLVLSSVVAGLRTVGMSALAEPLVLRDETGEICGTARVTATDPEKSESEISS